MERYKIRIYKAAKQDLLDIIDYVNLLLPQAAHRLYDTIVDKIASLSEMPERHAFLKDTNLRLKGYRAFAIKNYLVFYVVKGNVVQIRRVLYGKRDYEWLL